MGEPFYISNELPTGSCWIANKTVGGTRLKELKKPDENLAKVRFSKEVFEILRQKRKIGETVREALERIIRSSA
ncbi:hypothetical protein QN395_08270 [Undibacterium sp. RTI2.2]|uniref:hypothetical protein n=1 Tax=unclassified Undibacterium TaxID=2630295 RepID=UPI002AB45FB6|nr:MULTISPECIES: hypothetical protein [unclassified Undibacterium]MDY7539968.1 hypothetical protein [Undibacterium sp. 5I1]MEB0116479.1 hypothetical protein [Undibacterium sp. RTI2.2]MEB0232724.1 hypothetical protein [Undibacterium sp. 10I3]MEB0257273.1 hypothetical protein [Undibacterium sp. 5I1]